MPGLKLGLGLGNSGSGTTIPAGAFITKGGKVFVTSDGKTLVVAGA